MKHRAALATVIAALALGGCAAPLPYPVWAARPDASPTQVTAPQSAAPTDTPSDAAPSPTAFVPGGPSGAPTPTGPAPSGTAAGVQAYTARENAPVADPATFIARVKQATRRTARFNVSYNVIGSASLLGLVDRTDPATLLADVWLFPTGGKSGNSVHVIIIGDDVYTRFSKAGDKVLHTPMAKIPADVREDLLAVLDPSTVTDALAGHDIVYRTDFTIRDENLHSFDVGEFGSRPRYEVTTYSTIEIDDDLRLRSFVEMVDGSAKATMRVSPPEKGEKVTPPPRELVVEDPTGKAWRKGRS